MPIDVVPDISSAPLILASRSEARARVLREAGVAVEVMPAAIDEDAVKASLRAEGAPPRDIADLLADLKAQRVAGRRPDRLVLGADQVLVLDGEIFDKPPDRAAARAQLQALRGRRHELLSAAVVFEAGAPVWRHIGRAQLTMRPFSDAFIESYLDAEGAAVLDCVGAYRIEGRGAQLFARVDGDIFSIMGLPLLECLGFLRTRGICIE
ncbi:MAG: nucleoside triphosphate pyrophosphatase [Amaricoccus sp.]|uniref:Maf family protein n=1 Tax=Amaricoccus sp. TaxID=1872485 RepID=UPI0039E362CB